MIKKCGVVVVLMMISSAVTALSPWAEEWGAHAPYGPPLYNSGFGRAGRDDYDGSSADDREAAKHRKLTDLTEKVRIQARSRIVFSSVYTVSISSSIGLSAVQYDSEVYEIRTSVEAVVVRTRRVHGVVRVAMVKYVPVKREGKD